MEELSAHWQINSLGLKGRIKQNEQEMTCTDHANSARSLLRDSDGAGNDQRTHLSANEQNEYVQSSASQLELLTPSLGSFDPCPLMKIADPPPPK